MAVSRRHHVILVVLVTLAMTSQVTCFLWGNSEETSEEDMSNETSEEIWDRLETEEIAVSTKTKNIEEQTAKLGTEDLIAMDKKLDADIERDAYNMTKKFAEKGDYFAFVESSEEKILPAETEIQKDQAQGDRRYSPSNALSYNTQMDSGLVTFDVRPLEKYMRTCQNCYEHVGTMICPMHQPSLELRKWAQELEDILSHGCMKPENCDKPGTCCVSRKHPIEPTIVRMTQMLKDTFMTLQKNCDKCGVVEWSSWQEWSSCSVTCGVGSQMRFRTCKSSSNRRISCDGPSREKRQCFKQPCCEASQWGEWCAWGECSNKCGGLKTRTRSCIAQRGCPADDCDGRNREEMTCGLRAIDGNWGSWQSWVVSGTCGRVRKTRSRLCNNPAPNECGKPCIGKDRDIYDDELPPCSCKFTSFEKWTQWGGCSASCGGGTKTRQRWCKEKSESLRPGRSCPQNECQVITTGKNPYHESKTCNEQPCCGNWQWSSWTYGECDVTCGDGTRTKTRVCKNVRPGPYCPNQPYQCDRSRGTISSTEQCYGLPPCPKKCIEREWTPWGGWSSCPVTCGGSRQERTRFCRIVTGERECSSQCSGSRRQTRECGNTPCSCSTTKLSQWSQWGGCSASCGPGMQTRQRWCEEYSANVMPGGLCPAQECQAATTLNDPLYEDDLEIFYEEIENKIGPRYEETKSCNKQQCCEVKEWRSWQPWTSCTETCNRCSEQHKATRTRFRYCDTVQRGQKCRTDAEMCPGQPEEQLPCDSLPCCPPPYDPPYYGNWGDWCPCDCKTGKESRRRGCFSPETNMKVDLSLCQNLGASREERYCDLSRSSCPACRTSCMDSRGNPLPDGKYPSCSSCAHYIECTSGRLQEFNCGKYLEWDGYATPPSCVSGTSGSCSLQKPVSDCREKADGSKYHSERGCSWYIECYQGRLRERECRNGREFNAMTKSCKEGKSRTCVRPLNDYNRAVVGGRRYDLIVNDAPASMIYRGPLNALERRLAFEKRMKEMMKNLRDDELTAAKNAERVRLGLDPAPVNETAALNHKDKFIRRINPDCVSDCSDIPAGHYGSCRACNAYVICTKHGHLINHRCHGGKEFDVAKRKCVTSSQTCVLRGVLTDGA